jgi:hypothetical protein
VGSRSAGTQTPSSAISTCKLAPYPPPPPSVKRTRHSPSRSGCRQCRPHPPWLPGAP